MSIAALLLAFPAISAAAIRYAVPGASGAEPCNPTPCTLQRAVNGAADGDQVQVAAGTYKPTVEVEIDHAIDVGGQPGAALPVVQISEHFLHEKDAAATVHDLRIEVVKETMPYAITDEAGTVERVYAYSTESAGACQVASGTIRDSVCWGGLSADGYGGGNAHILLRNVTATSTVMGAGSGTNVTIDGANLIMHSIDPKQSNGADLAVDVTAGSSATIVLTHSNYATVETGASSGTAFSYTPPGTNGNQTAPPQLVNAAAGDVHELPGSPTVDAGLAEPQIGTTDLEGNPRSQPSCIGGSATPDIGAYELAPVAPCPPAAGSIKLVKVKLDKRRGTATVLALVSGAGTVILTGKGLRKTTGHAHGVGIVKLLVRTKGKAKKLLAHKGKVTVKARVAFTPSGGTPVRVTKKIVLKKSMGM